MAEETATVRTGGSEEEEEEAHERTPGMYLLVGVYSALFFLGYLYYFWDVAVRWRVS